jgi:hypothetical protein
MQYLKKSSWKAAARVKLWNWAEQDASMTVGASTYTASISSNVD